ncbi:MAG: endonuclease domain-containing protein [Propionibacteriales bacterium]|nr:endonuclease domain-containing protein [Propionibacteriales bacterium]
MKSGVVSRAEALCELSQQELDQAGRLGQLSRIRHGWYATPTATASVVAAVRAGGRLGCLSALAFHGLWVPPTSGLHVLFRRRARLGPEVEAHLVPRWTFTGAVEPLPEALAHVIGHHDAETALMVLESALNLRRIGIAEAEQLTRRAPTEKSRVLAHLNPLAGAGTETRLRLFHELRGVPVIAQYEVAGVGWCDLLVGESLILEADSKQHHTGVENYSRDRARDLQLHRLGYDRLRFTYEQVMFQWQATRAALSALLATRRHRRPPRPF